MVAGSTMTVLVLLSEDFCTFSIQDALDHLFSTQQISARKEEYIPIFSFTNGSQVRIIFEIYIKDDTHV